MILLRNYDIQWATLQVFRECDVHSFPLNCFRIAEHYGFKLIKYTTLSESKRLACMELSEDACVIGDTLFYNDQMCEHRIRFSIAHELGHHILGTVNESDANQFAGYLLAPRMAIHYAECKNHADVARIFNISEEAADYAFQDYRRWHRIAVKRMTQFDKKIYQHFYHEEQKKFVYSITYCYDCDRVLYNQPGEHQCYWCGRRYIKYQRDIFHTELLSAWL